MELSQEQLAEFMAATFTFTINGQQLDAVLKCLLNSPAKDSMSILPIFSQQAQSFMMKFMASPDVAVAPEAVSEPIADTTETKAE